MEQQLIVVKQLPEIEEHLKLIQQEIKEKVDAALAMVCTEETVKEIKAIRAELNKDFTGLESKRKEVKTAILSPYEQFEAIYKACVTDIFKPADAQLKAKIDEVENALKEEKAAELIAYFLEYCESKGVDFVNFNQTGITVTLSASLKSLKEQAKAFVDKVSDELALIDTQENKSEILVEYKNTLNVAQAITTVSNRMKAIAAEKERKEAIRARQEAESEIVAKVETVIEEEVLAPVIVTAPIEDEKLLTARFTVTTTLQKLKDLKKYLTEGEINYEQF